MEWWPEAEWTRFARSAHDLPLTTSSGRQGGLRFDKDLQNFRPHIYRRSPSNAIQDVYRNRETCLPDQESNRGTTECDQVLPVPYSSYPVILDRYHDSQNQEALRRLVSLRFHVRRNRTRLLPLQRHKRDPAARQNECFLPRIPL
jgi:hypothetical protein